MSYRGTIPTCSWKVEILRMPTINVRITGVEVSIETFTFPVQVWSVIATGILNSVAYYDAAVYVKYWLISLNASPTKF